MRIQFTFLAMIVATAFVARAATPSDDAVIARLAEKRYFYEPIIPLGGEHSNKVAQASELLPVLEKLAGHRKSTAIDGVEAFLARNPRSPWAPSLRANLAQYYRETGRYSDALSHWNTAWNAISNHSDRAAANVGDYVLAHWLRLLASLGRETELKTVLSSIGNRRLKRADWQKNLAEVKQAVVAMEETPGKSFKCGTLSLLHVAPLLNSTIDLTETVLKTPSPRTGFSVQSLLDIAGANGIKMVAARRLQGDEVVVPSIVHWRQQHYAAIVATNRDAVHVVDPTFGESRWLPRAAINREATGIFLVATKVALPRDWEYLSPEEAKTTYGRGVPNYDYDPAPPICFDECTCAPGGLGLQDLRRLYPEPFQSPIPWMKPRLRGPYADRGVIESDGSFRDCSKCKISYRGMPEWNVTEPHTTLALIDIPLFYHPALGGEMLLRLTHRQRDSRSGDAAIPGFGALWSGNWIDFIEVESVYPATDYSRFSATRNLGDGGGGWKYYTSTDGKAQDRRKGTLLQRIWDGAQNQLTGFSLSDTMGNTRHYNFLQTMSGAQPRVRAYLTHEITRFGYTNVFVYTMTNGNARLEYVIDADGNTNALQYANSNYANCITGVVTPYGSTISISYNSTNGLIETITDMGGITSSFIYNDARIGVDELTEMTTPYGATQFAYTGVAGGDVSGAPIGRSVLVTAPDGAKHFFAYRDDCSGAPLNYPSQIPNAPAEFPGYSASNQRLFGNVYMHYRNSFYWGPRQYALLSTTDHLNFTAADYLLARRRNYLHLAYINEAGTASVYSSVVSGVGMYGFTSVLNMEQGPSPDGSIAGHRIWYGYRKKPIAVGAVQGNVEGWPSVPAVEAWVLDDGTAHYTYYERNEKLHSTNIVTTWSVGEGVEYRTNRIAYATNAFDIIEVRDASGEREMGVAYNGNHQVLFKTNAIGEVTSFTYDPVTLLLTSTQTPSGLTTTNLYDSANRLAEVVDIEISRTNKFTYTNGLVRTHTDPRGLTITNTYDALERLVRTDFPDGTYTSNNYNNLDLVGQRDRLGNWRHFVYDPLRRRTAETNELGHATVYSYCSCGALESVTDALSNTTQLFYDKAGRRTATLLPDGSSQTNQFNAIGQLVKVSDSLGMNVTNYYNNQGLLVASSNAFGRILAHTFDEHDRVTNSIDANGVAVRIVYDPLDRVVGRLHPDNSAERFQFSSLGLVGHTNQNNSITRMFYDPAGRKTRETNGNLEILQFSYNPAGDLLTLTDGKNQVTQWEYDQFGRITNKTDAVNTVIFRYGYDANDRLTNRWTPAKLTTLYRYDAVGNLTNVDYSSSTDLRLSYDALNRLTNMVDAAGTTRYSYNALDAVSVENGPFVDDEVSYSYTNTLRTAMTVGAVAGPHWAKFAYSYDVSRRLSTVSDPVGPFTYKYRLNPGLLVSSIGLPPGAYITNQFDSVGRMSETVLKNSSGTVLNSHAYQRGSAVSSIIQVTRAGGSRVLYEYDPADQLKVARGQESGGGSRIHERFGYKYDAAGNLQNKTNHNLVQTFGHNNLNQITNYSRNSSGLVVAGMVWGDATSVQINGGASTLYADDTFASELTYNDGANSFYVQAFDAAGRSADDSVTVYHPNAMTFIYDANGNLLSDGRRHFTYDDENQLTQVVVTNSTKSEFTYDAKMRRRVRKEWVWVAGTWQFVQEVRYVYDGLLVLQERHFDPRLSTTTPVENIVYTRGSDISGSFQGAGGIGGLLDRIELVAGSPEPAFYHCDNVGNISALIDAEEMPVARYLYEPFGTLVARSGPLADANLYRFSTKEAHEQSGLVYYLYRFYEPTIQRWLNQDPMGEMGGINLYSFVANSPLAYIDPVGYEMKPSAPSRPYAPMPSRPYGPFPRYQPIPTPEMPVLPPAWQARLAGVGRAVGRACAYLTLLQLSGDRAPEVWRDGDCEFFAERVIGKYKVCAYICPSPVGNWTGYIKVPINARCSKYIEPEKLRHVYPPLDPD